eukprot:3448404-Pyramimonas_sp.AAC.1
MDTISVHPSHASRPHRKLHQSPRLDRPHPSTTTQHSASWPPKGAPPKAPVAPPAYVSHHPVQRFVAQQGAPPK